MNNAWFANRPHVLSPQPGHSRGMVRLGVQGVRSIGLYHENTRFGGRWKDCKRLGNDAPPPAPGSSLAASVSQEGYAHDSTTCARCKDDKTFEQSIKAAIGEGSDEAYALLEKGRVRGKCNGVKEIVVLGE
ncbi:hypothetical protein H0H87_004371, partial [Tephrocybe sp. NHM501043]